MSSGPAVDREREMGAASGEVAPIVDCWAGMSSTRSMIRGVFGYGCLKLSTRVRLLLHVPLPQLQVRPDPWQ